MGHLIFEHAAGREVYGDEPRYSEDWLCGDGTRSKNGVESVCDPNNLIERRVSPPQFGADGRLILKPRDPAACAKLMATIDRILGVEAVVKVGGGVMSETQIAVSARGTTSATWQPNRRGEGAMKPPATP